MSMRARRAIAFDLDGTLVDSARDIHDALAAAIDDPRLTEDVTRSLIGHGARHLVERALVVTGRAQDDVDATLARFRAIYDAAPTRHTVPYEGIPGVLSTLRARDIAIAVCTNKPAPLARVVVHELLPGLCDVVLGPEDAGAHKPDKAILDVAEARLGAPLAAFVGDSAVDVETARNKRVPCVFVTWGLGRDRPARDAMTHVVDDAASLAASLHALLDDG